MAVALAFIRPISGRVVHQTLLVKRVDAPLICCGCDLLRADLVQFHCRILIIAVRSGQGLEGWPEGSEVVGGAQADDGSVVTEGTAADEGTPLWLKRRWQLKGL